MPPPSILAAVKGIRLTSFLYVRGCHEGEEGVATRLLPICHAGVVGKYTMPILYPTGVSLHKFEIPRVTHSRLSKLTKESAVFS